MIYLTLMLEFFKTGLFAIGGGLATLPFLSDMANRYTWITHTMISEMLAISESTPGPIGINMATYAGYMAGGFFGALVATVSLVLPSLIVIMLISRFFASYRNNKYVDNAFNTLRPAVTGLIAAAGYQVIATTLFACGLSLASITVGYKAWILFALLMVMTNLPKLKKLHPVVYIGLSALAGMAFGM